MKEYPKVRVSWDLHFRIRNKTTGIVEEFLDKIPHNLVTNEGLNHLLDAVFHGATQVDPWYVGLKLTGAVAATDTYSGMISDGEAWDEFEEYSNHRKEFVEGAAASQAISNTGSVAQFDITSAGQIYGAILTSVESKTENPAGAVLFSAGDINSFRTVDSGDQVNITLTIATSGT